MLRARRLASTTVAALAMFGCAGDSIVAPRTAAPTPAQLVEQSLPQVRAAVDTVASPLALVGAQARDTSHGVALSVPTTNNSTRNERYSREQTLGFERETATKSCIGEGASTGQWQLRYNGFGCVALTSDESGTALTMQPAAAEADGQTHAPLLLGPEYGDRMIISTRLETVQQLRRNGEPNAWEVAWIVWQYQDDDHFYYFIPKPNGWELGKRDPAYPGGQRFLATSSDQKFPVGQAYNVQVTHRGNVFAIVVDNVPIVSFTDNERPYLSGRVALYSEDAAIKVHQVSVRSGL
jgi:hypothetical protein